MSQRSGSVLGGAVALVSGQAVQAAAAFAANLFLAHRLDPGSFGHFAVVLAGTTLTVSFTTLRVEVLILRSGEDDHDRRLLLSSALWVETVLAGAVLAGWLAVGGLAHAPEIGLAVAMLARHWLNTNRAFRDRRLHFPAVALGEGIATLASHALSVAAVMAGLGGNALYLREIALSLLLAVVWGRFGVLSPLPFRRPRRAEMVGLLREVRAIWLDSLLDVGFLRITMLAVAALAGEGAAGLFYQAQRLAVVPFQLLAPVVGRMASALLGATEREARWALLTRMLRAVALPLAAAGLGALLLADPVVPWLLGEPWRGAAGLLTAMAGMAACMSLFELLRSYGNVTGCLGAVLAGRMAQYGGVLLPVLVAPTLGSLALGLSLAYGLGTAVLFVRLRAGRPAAKPSRK